MASREFLEDGTEGPFHPYRSFATRAIRADVESPHGQEDEFRLVASSDFARLRYQRAAYPFVGPSVGMPTAAEGAEAEAAPPGAGGGPRARGGALGRLGPSRPKRRWSAPARRASRK